MQELTLLLQYHNVKCDPILKNVEMMREKSKTSFEEISAEVKLNIYYKPTEY